MSGRPVLAVPHSSLVGPRKEWQSAAWSGIAPKGIDNFLHESSLHRPETRFRLAWSEAGFCGIFKVSDSWALALHTGFGAPVWKDSCVEFFVTPSPEKGYFNFEFAANGAFLAGFVTDPQRTAEGGLKGFRLLDEEEAALVEVFPSLGAGTFAEGEGEVEWTLGFFIPAILFERYYGENPFIKGRKFRANFQKCADGSTHPHWSSWSPLPAKNFHLPDSFGELILV